MDNNDNKLTSDNEYIVKNAQILVMDFMIIGEYTNTGERVIIKAEKEYFISIEMHFE